MLCIGIIAADKHCWFLTKRAAGAFFCSRSIGDSFGSAKNKSTPFTGGCPFGGLLHGCFDFLEIAFCQGHDLQSIVKIMGAAGAVFDEDRKIGGHAVKPCL